MLPAKWLRARRILPLALFSGLAALTFAGTAADEPNTEALRQLRDLTSEVMPAAERDAAARMVSTDIQRRLREANVASTNAWRQIGSLKEWQKFRAEKLQALRDSLGSLPARPAAPRMESSGSLAGEGFTVEKLLFESRPGLWVTANLYRPEPLRERMPGFLICHSHHNPKTETELQTMGATWARAGCLMLVMDQLGHGERREHPFRSASDYKAEFRAGRQDYYFRYDVSLQLYLIGDSLMGWMVHDVMCGVDVLLAQKGIDPERIILLGAVAGGGDPAAVAAALDSRITVAVPFNFGGPQPESRFPLPADSEDTFGYAGGGSWESTRNLRLSAAGGFLPWAIVGSIAPRRLIYSHEFSWDREHDPVWKRLEQIYSWAGASDNLAFAHGAGLLSGQPPTATHCNNIGAPHRKFIHAALNRWYQIDVKTQDEYRQSFPAQQLLCWTAELEQKLKPKKARELAAKIAQDQSHKEQQRLLGLPAPQRREAARSVWKSLLADIGPREGRGVVHRHEVERLKSGTRVERLVLEAEPGIQIPMLLLVPDRKEPVPLVLAISQQGKAELLKNQTGTIEQLLSRGIAVCLPDLRGIGETGSNDRSRGSRATSVSASELMLGGTILGARLRDLRVVLRHLREDSRLDTKRIGLWGDSSAPVNASDAEIVVPHGIDGQPAIGDPGAGLLALLGALYEDDVRAVATRRSLSMYASAMQGPRVHLPHDAIVPGAASAGDIPAIVSCLTPTPLRMIEPIDGANRAADAPKNGEAALADWFAEQLLQEAGK